jgi:hypothetical protein
MAQERERQRVGGEALSRLGEGGRGKGAHGLVGWIDLLGQMATGTGERKRKIEIYFEIDFQL